MFIVDDIQTLRARLAEWRRESLRIALVPTMGNLHAGHHRLIEHGRTRADRVVVSIFVNPMQFDRAEDLAAYPRTMDVDLAQLRELKTDLVFAPASDTIYPQGMENTARVVVPRLGDILEGESRPGHFAGVATVVTKLFNLVQPDVAVFGEKDYQQLLVIRRLVAELNFAVEIEGLPTVREPDELAMSSRNRNLDADKRNRATRLYACLRALGDRIRDGERDFDRLQAQTMRELSAQGFRVDYVSIRDASDLSVPNPQIVDLVLLGAAWLGRTRLIDNIRVTLMDSRLSPIIRRSSAEGPTTDIQPSTHMRKHT
ncbi:MAG: pantoate--beta-alanine ligase [Gammaproteobacteria bacterium]|nr:pantoate--beta-alanine ligase [Gammaproteobacteria bacterium]